MDSVVSSSQLNVILSTLPLDLKFIQWHLGDVSLTLPVHKKSISLHSFFTATIVISLTCLSCATASVMSSIGDDFINSISALLSNKSMFSNIFGVQFSNADTFLPWLSRRAGSA